MRSTKMAIGERIYRRTWAGQRAWEAQAPKVSPECWKVLGSIGAGAHAAMVCASLQNCSEEDIREWLAQLEQIGLVESLPVIDKTTSTSPATSSLPQSAPRSRSSGSRTKR